MEDSMTERGFGADSGLDQEETSASKDVRAGYQDDDDRDQPAPRVVEETGEDDVDSHAADIAAGFEDEDSGDRDTSR
jgi:hypothetical protein